MRKLRLVLRYQPRRVRCERCGVRVEDFPRAEPWARVTRALANAAASLIRELSWQGTARHFVLNWKTVAGIVQRASGDYDRIELAGLTVVYDLERRVLLWVGEDRTEEAVKKFFTEELRKSRCRTLRVVCMDMWPPT